MRGKNKGFVKLQRKIDGKTNPVYSGTHYDLPDIINREKFQRLVTDVCRTGICNSFDLLDGFRWSSSVHLSEWVDVHTGAIKITDSMREECASWAEQLGIQV